MAPPILPAPRMRTVYASMNLLPCNDVPVNMPGIADGADSNPGMGLIKARERAKSDQGTGD